MEREQLLERYHEARMLLEDLVRAWPLYLPATAYENARFYLDFHCVWCGARLTMDDLVGVLELEMARIGTVDVRDIPRADPRCLDCYRRQHSGDGIVIPMEQNIAGP